MNAVQRAMVVGLTGLGVMVSILVGWFLATRQSPDAVPTDQYTPLYERTFLDATGHWGGEQEPQPVAVQPQPAGPMDFQTAMSQGQAAFDQQLYPQAVQFFAIAANLQPDSALPWAHMGDCYLRTNQADQAIIAYGRSTRLAPELLSAWYGLGVACRAAGQLDEAIQAFEAVRQMSPTETFAAQQIEQIRALQRAASQPSE